MKTLLALVLLAALTACSGGGGAGGARETSNAEQAIRKAAQEYSDAYLTGDGSTAYGLLSQRCKDRMTEAGMAALVALAASEYGTALTFSAFDADVNGEQARVTYSYADSAEIDQSEEPWVFEDGSWREDDC